MKLDPDDHTILGTQGNQIMYISKKDLNQQLERSHILSSLLYQSEVSLNARDTATLKEIINCQREILAKNCDKLPQDKKRNKEVKHLSQKLLEQFNKENEKRMKNCENSPLLKHNRYLMAPMGEDMFKEGSTHESDTSSQADERDIHFNLKKIHNFLES